MAGDRLASIEERARSAVGSNRSRAALLSTRSDFTSDRLSLSEVRTKSASGFVRLPMGRCLLARKSSRCRVRAATGLEEAREVRYLVVPSLPSLRCRTIMNPTAEILAGRYRLGPLLGQGGMSDVYEAEDARTGTAVAVKVVRSGDPDLGRRLHKKPVPSSGYRHPGLVRLLDSGFAGSQTYLVMELVLGRPLSDQLRPGH